MVAGDWAIKAPALSFPLTDERKSGWLPPSVAIDSRSGVHLEVPWYWNIAPNRDATFTPSASIRRGVGLGSEFRYLEENYHGELNLNLLPHDREAGRTRYAFGAKHEVAWADDTRLSVRMQRVSDDDYWKDFRTGITAFSVLTGTGVRFDNHWAAVTLAADGTAFVGL